MQTEQSQMNESIEVNSFIENGISIQFTPSKRKKTRKINILIEGDFSITNVNKVYDVLNNTVSKYDVSDICIKNITQFDLAAIQCLYKLKTKHLNENRTILLESELSESMRSFFHNTGLLPIITKPILIA